MYTDIIRYRLKDGVTQEDLLDAAGEILESWMKKQVGFISWQINTSEDGEYTDIVQWESEEAAKKAEASMRSDLSFGNAWFACYNMSSISATKAREVKKFS